MQKTIEKQTYPPIYAPKANHKIAIGTTISSETNQIKSMSPLHTGRTFMNNLQQNGPNHIIYKPVSQPSSSVNTSLTGMTPTVKMVNPPIL
jgi:hypothetical protein